MATAETVELGPPHEPKEASITAFAQILPEVRTTLVNLRKTQDKHEPEFFKSVAQLSDDQLATFSEKDLVLVRVGTSAYGLHLFGKVGLPHAPGAFIHMRAFVGGNNNPAEAEDRTVRLHCIHIEEIETSGGNKTFRAIFDKADPLEWFDT